MIFLAGHVNNEKTMATANTLAGLGMDAGAVPGTGRQTLTRYAGEPGLSSPGDGLQPLGDFMFVRPNRLLEDLSVAEENQARPDLDPKRAASGRPGPSSTLMWRISGCSLRSPASLGPAPGSAGTSSRRTPAATGRSSGRFRLASARDCLRLPRSTFEIMSPESCLISQIAKSPLKSQHPENTLSDTF